MTFLFQTKGEKENNQKGNIDPSTFSSIKLKQKNKRKHGIYSTFMRHVYTRLQRVGSTYTQQPTQKKNSLLLVLLYNLSLVPNKMLLYKLHTQMQS